VSLPLPAPERVLPTLNHDGTRRWKRPRVSPGRFHGWRRAVAAALVATFVVLPFVRVGGKPALLLDVQARRFHLFGATFLPTDGALLMLLMLSIFVGIVLLSAVLGRVWCGWGCPQTVYLEFLFRPIARFFDGGAYHRPSGRASGARTAGKYLTFAVLSVAIGNVFLAYFVGTDVLREWVTRSPTAHPTGFLVMGVTSALVFFDFAYFREQMCTIICPYARLQSVLLDKQSLIIGYDAKRGEPRGKLGTVKGDCVDCGACVKTCPTGIDIREGLQLECVACAQCIDACDGIMDRIGRPRGLVRYTSKNALEGSGRRGIGRPRVYIYPVILAGLLTALFLVGRSKGGAELTLLRGIGAPYVEDGAVVRNHVRLRTRNRADAPHAYRIELVGGDDLALVAPQNPLPVSAGELATESVFVAAPRGTFAAGKREITIRVTDAEGDTTQQEHRLLGPSGGAPWRQRPPARGASGRSSRRCS